WDGDAPPIKAMTITAQRYQPKAPIFGGGGGEIAHGNYYPNDDILREVKESSSPIDRLIANFSRSIGCHPDAPELVTHRLHQLQEVIRATGIDGPTILDAFYLKERFRRWVAAGHETHSVLLFACPGFVRLAFDATPEERRA